MARVRIAIVSDTHLPRGGRTLPERAREEIAAADLLLHAGDFTSVAFHDEIAGIGTPMLAVYGNADEAALQRRLPEAREIPIAGGAPLAMIHIAGPAQGRLARMRRRFPRAQAVVFGHSHIPLHEADPHDGFQIFNPGSAADRRRQPEHTLGVATVESGRIAFSHVALG